MPGDFDPQKLRHRWRSRLLEFYDKEGVASVARTARNHFSQIIVGNLVEAYLIGFAGPVDAILRRQLAGMLSGSEPVRSDFAANPVGEESWCRQLFEWRQALGLCKWLSEEPAESTFAAALTADWCGLQAAQADDYVGAQVERWDRMSLRLALALAADRPQEGLDIAAACALSKHYEAFGPLVGFGSWACHRLVSGGRRDREFVERGSRALTATLLPVLLPLARKCEIGLWIKAIFFDSGAAATAEQAMILAYDCMPGVRRPDFDARQPKS